MAPARPAPPVAQVAQPATGYKVTFRKSGKSVLTVGDAPLLDLAEANGVDIGYQCRSGSCGECLVLCAKGNVNIDDHCAISDDDRAKGFIYACCTQPASDVEIDA